MHSAEYSVKDSVPAQGNRALAAVAHPLGNYGELAPQSPPVGFVLLLVGFGL